MVIVEVPSPEDVLAPVRAVWLFWITKVWGFRPDSSAALRLADTLLSTGAIWEALPGEVPVTAEANTCEAANNPPVDTGTSATRTAFRILERDGGLICLIGLKIVA